MRNKIRQLASLSDSSRTAWAKPPNPAAVRTLSTVRTCEYSVGELLRAGLQQGASRLQLKLHNVVSCQKSLRVFAPGYIQQGAGNYRSFFFAQTSTGDNIPTLLLLESCSFFNNARPNTNHFSRFVGHDYQIYGPHFGLFVTRAECGERTVGAPHLKHLQTVTAAAEYLDMAHKFLGAVLSLKNTTTSDALVCGCWPARWDAVERHIGRYHPSDATYDATLGYLGRHTHQNFNAGCRHAAVRVGPDFPSNLKLTQGKSLLLNQARDYPLTGSIGRWRYNFSLEGVPQLWSLPYS